MAALADAPARVDLDRAQGRPVAVGPPARRRRGRVQPPRRDARRRSSGPGRSPRPTADSATTSGSPTASEPDRLVDGVERLAAAWAAYAPASRRAARRWPSASDDSTDASHPGRIPPTGLDWPPWPISPRLTAAPSPTARIGAVVPRFVLPTTTTTSASASTSRLPRRPAGPSAADAPVAHLRSEGSPGAPPGAHGHPRPTGTSRCATRTPGWPATGGRQRCWSSGCAMLATQRRRPLAPAGRRRDPAAGARDRPRHPRRPGPLPRPAARDARGRGDRPCRAGPRGVRRVVPGRPGLPSWRSSVAARQHVGGGTLHEAAPDRPRPADRPG